jgi:hypothetical protein
MSRTQAIKGFKSKLKVALSSLVQLPSLLLFSIFLFAAGNASAITESVNVTGGGVLTFNRIQQSIKNTGCFDIPYLYWQSYTSFSYSNASVSNPTAIASFKVTGCLDTVITRTPAKLFLANGCAIDVQTGPISAALTCPNVMIHPKYIVVGVTYAPPGPSSSVQYTQANLTQTTITDASSYLAGTTQTVSLSAGGKIFGAVNGSVVVSSTSSASQTTSSTNATTISFSDATSYRLTGPPTPTVSVNTPINHDYDIIWLWLNPIAMYTVNASSPKLLQFNGFAYDMADMARMDIYPVQVGQLNGRIPMSASMVNVLSRSWAASNQTFPAGGGPGLTAADYVNILAYNPYSNSAYSVPPTLITSLDKRYSLTGTANGNVQSFFYGPGQLTQTYSNTYVDSTIATQGVTLVNTQSYGVDVTTSVTAGLTYSAALKTLNTQTWTNTQSKAITNTTTQINQLSIGSPCSSCAYTGPTVFAVYQDNIFGTFMFDPVR